MTFLEEFARMYSRTLLVFLTPDTYTGVLFTRGTTLLSLWALSVVPGLAPLIGPGTLPDAPGEVPMCTAYFGGAPFLRFPVSASEEFSKTVIPLWKRGVGAERTS